MKNKRNLFLVLPLLLGSSCSIGPAVGPNYQKPTFSALPATWLTPSSTVPGPSASMPWWADFHDPLLSALITEAVEKNGDFKAAQAAIEVARGARLAAQANTLPSISASGTATRGKSSQTNTLSSQEQALGQASWEVDLFGKNRRTAEAARAALGGARATAHLVEVQVESEVVTTYLSVRSLQAQLAAATRSLATQDETISLLELQQKEGVISNLALLQATAQRADTAAQVPQLEATLQKTIFALGALTGQTPQEVQQRLQDVKPVPTSNQKALIQAPAHVIANRPDVQIAERALAEATANQGVALAAWFPTISVSGLFGLAETTAIGGTHPWSLTGTATLPLIDFGRIRGLVRQANAKQQAALATYEQTLLNALADVESSLVGYQKAQERAQKLTDAADANSKALSMAKLQQKEGVASTLDVLTAEQKSLNANIAKAAGDAAQGQALATLYKALGGPQ